MADHEHFHVGSFLPRLWKGFTLGIVFGGIFGVVVSFLYLLTGSFSVIVLIIPVCGTFLGGLAGLVGVLLEQILFHCGLTNRIYGNLITFVILTVFGVVILGLFIPWSQKQYLILGVLGCLFGAGVNFYNYRLEKMKQRVATLELENKFLGELASKDRKLQELTNHLAVMEERNRMARELHDSVSQGIHGIVFAVHSLKENARSGNTDRMNQVIHHLEKTAEATLAELRAMIMELKPAETEDRDLLQAIRIHCELFVKRQQLELELDLNEITTLTPSQEMCVYRVIQEALANIQRHAAASRVTIICERIDPRSLKLVIADNGKGFDPEQVCKGNGLMNMAERCRENGAEFAIRSGPGVGTSVELLFRTQSFG